MLEAALTLLLLTSPPEMATVSYQAVRAPTSLSIIACRVDDLTGQEGRQDPSSAAKGWRDLEWHIDAGLELQCKREVVDLTDQEEMKGADPISPGFSNWSQCVAAAMSYASKWNDQNQGWAVLAVGCPVPIVNEDGQVLSYKMPECPSYMPGTSNRIKCRFDASVI